MISHQMLRDAPPRLGAPTMSMLTCRVSLGSDSRRGSGGKGRAGHSIEALEGRVLFSSITEFGGLTAGSAAIGITTGPDGNLWFAEYSGDAIGRITPAGVVTEFPLHDGGNPNYITTGPDGNLWFTEQGTDRIGQITTSGVATTFALTAGSQPTEITTGPDGNLWFDEYGSGRIASITTSGVITEFSLASGSGPYGIVTGPNGNLWFTELGSSKIGEIVPSGVFEGVITEFFPSSGAQPYGITVGPDGNLWFAEIGRNSIGNITTGGIVTEYTIPTSNVYPEEIVSGPNGDLYFSEVSSSAIGQVTTDGAFDQIPTPTHNSEPTGIAAGPDDHIWFAESGVDQIARLNLNPAAADDSYTYAEDFTLTQNSGGGVLANDSDPEGDSLTAVKVSDPAHGSVTLSPDGSFIYTPDLNYSGADSFTYEASDGTDVSNIATVNLTGDPSPVVSSTTLVATEDLSFSTGVASFIDANPNALISDFTATIAWGDGTNSSGTITQPGGIGTSFNVTGSHLYADEGTYSVTVQVADPLNATGTAVSTADVADAPLTAQGLTLASVDDLPLAGAIASFTDANPVAPTSDFSASIDWGDGSTSTGVITQPGGVGTAFQVLGNHTYLGARSYSVSVQIDDAGGSTASASSTVVNHPDPATTTTLALTPVAPLDSRNVLISAQVVCDSGSPTGTVTFTDGPTTLGTGSVVAGEATITADFDAGTHAIVATYSGSPGFAASNSAPLPFTVAQAPLATVSAGALIPTITAAGASTPKPVKYTIAIIDAPGVKLHGTQSAWSKTGHISFKNLMITQAGTYTLAISTPGQGTILQETVAIVPAKPHALVFITEPTDTIPGTGFTVAVKVVDAFKNVVTAAASGLTISLQSVGRSKPLNGTLTVSFVDGVATFSDLSVPVAGNYRLLARMGIPTIAVSSSIFKVA
jgi:streptogramin lyase